MLRERAETMPAVTEPPSPNGLPMATTQSPTLASSESPNSTKGRSPSPSSFFTPQDGEVGLDVPPQHLGGAAPLVAEDDGDLVGLRDDVVVGHDDTARIDHEPGAERRHPPRRTVLVPAVVPGTLAFEEFLEEFLERRARRKPRHRNLAAPTARFLGRRDVDHGGGQLLRQIGERLGRGTGEGRGRADQRDREDRDARAPPERAGPRRAAPGFVGSRCRNRGPCSMFQSFSSCRPCSKGAGLSIGARTAGSRIPDRPPRQPGQNARQPER